MDALSVRSGENQALYVHWALAVLVVFLVWLFCYWGWIPKYKKMNGAEGMSPFGIGSSGAAQLNEWALAPGSTALSSLSPTSANQRYMDQSQVNFQPSVSNETSVDGVVAVNGTHPYRNILPTSGFLGGPQAPLFSAPPSAPGLQGHSYLKAVDAAQQAQNAGLGTAGAEAAVAAENMHGGKQAHTSFGKSGFSDQELSSLL